MSHVPTVLKSDRSVFDKMLPVDDNVFIYCLKTYKYWRSQKKIFRVTPGQAILVRKVNIHAYSMYVLLTDKVSCPMTQHYDSGDSPVSNPSTPTN